LLIAAGGALWWLMLHDLKMAAYALLGTLGVLLIAALVAWRSGHRRWGSALLVLVVATVSAGAFHAYNLNAKLDELPRLHEPARFDEGRPTSAPNKSLNILLLGADNPNPEPEKPTVAELLAQGSWDPGAYRSDSLMLLHIAADRKSASVVSIPRDSYVPIFDDEGHELPANKINAAFSAAGPYATLRTVEKLTGLRVDHMAIIDFEGFRDLTTAIGGVEVYVPEDVYDPKRKQQWTKGWTHLEGDVALNYVRMRYGLTNGDFDRVARQQNFLRALLAKLTDDGTLGNPTTLTKTLDVIVRYLAVDARWSSGDIRDLALGLGGLDQGHIRYVTLALDHYETIEGVGSANIIDTTKAAELWQAMAEDRVGKYLEKYPDDELGSAEDVS
jgi:LCP family protein required for cell wall assembly